MGRVRSFGHLVERGRATRPAAWFGCAVCLVGLFVAPDPSRESDALASVQSPDGSILAFCVVWVAYRTGRAAHELCAAVRRQRADPRRGMLIIGSPPTGRDSRPVRRRGPRRWSRCVERARNPLP